MKFLARLWRDQAGVLVSTEAVVVGTVAVVGLTAGLSAVSSAVNEELKDVGFAIRSLDQSYSIPSQSGCGAWTAGSCYQQEPVEKSLEQLQATYERAERAEKSQAKRLQEQLERQSDERTDRTESKQKGDKARKKKDVDNGKQDDKSKRQSKKRDKTA